MQAAAWFNDQFGRPPSFVAQSPGRVNLVGGHTDYNDGFVLPAGIGRYAWVAARAVETPRLEVAFSSISGRHLHDLTSQVGRLTGPMAYVAGVARELVRESDVRGAQVAVQGNVPMGAGLSSSAALELAVARALSAVWGLNWNPLAAARLGRRVEHVYAGVQCGIMDQMASALSAENHSLLIDCRSQAHERVPVPERWHIVVMDTGARRTLAGSAYNDRRAACERVVTALAVQDPAIHALRDVNLERLSQAQPRLDPTDYRRALHVVQEIGRPNALAEALRAEDTARAGQLLAASHAGLRDLYDVSSAELDTMVECATAHPGCIGARMTGAGFGGCAVALVHAEASDAFVAEVASAYAARTSRTPSLFSSPAVAGTRLL